MSEFIEVMRNWRRMCDTYTTEDAARCCQGCPMDGCGCGAIYENDNADPEVIVREVQRWAAEHPEPVYPSIAKYLERFGIIIRRDGSLEADFFKANEPMSAYMANLLGISPEEGENEKAD